MVKILREGIVEIRFAPGVSDPGDPKITWEEPENSVLGSVNRVEVAPVDARVP